MHDRVQRRILERKVAGLSLVEVEMLPGTVAPPARFPAASFQLVLSGGYREPPSDAVRLPNSVHFHPPEDVQAAVVTRRSRVFGICVPSDRAEAAERFGAFPDGPRDLSSPEIADCLRRLRIELHRPDDLTELAVEGLCAEMLALFAREMRRHPSERPPWLRRAYETVADAPHSRHTLRSVAEACGVHPSYLARRFRDAYGSSIGEHARRCRSEATVHWLQENDLPLEEAALRLGYCDASHLCRSVRQATGHTPHEIRTMRR